MTTKQRIDACLRHIGSEGYSGLTMAGGSQSLALNSLISDLVKDNVALSKNVARNLMRQKLVTVSHESGDKYRITITPAGAYRIAAIERADLTIPPMTPWDGLWRLVSYDIPSSKRSERYQLTKHLKRLGCYQLQGSMWVHPYGCGEVVMSLSDTLGVARYMTIAEVKRFDASTSSRLMKHFSQTMSLHR